MPLNLPRFRKIRAANPHLVRQYRRNDNIEQENPVEDAGLICGHISHEKPQATIRNQSGSPTSKYWAGSFRTQPVCLESQPRATGRSQPNRSFPPKQGDSRNQLRTAYATIQTRPKPDQDCGHPSPLQVQALQKQVPEKPRGPARRSGNGIRDEVLRHNLPATASGNQRLACRLQSVCLTRRCDKQQCRTSLTEQPTSGLCSTDKSVRYDRRCQRSYVLSFHGLCSPSRSSFARSSHPWCLRRGRGSAPRRSATHLMSGIPPAVELLRSRRTGLGLALRRSLSGLGAAVPPPVPPRRPRAPARSGARRRRPSWGL